MATESNTAPVTADQESALGLDANVVSALAYFLLPLVGFVLLFVEDSNEFVRFHAAQSVVTVLTIVFVRLSAEFVGSFLPGPVALLWGCFVGPRQHWLPAGPAISWRTGPIRGTASNSPSSRT